MSGFEKHMADVLRNHEVAPPAGLEAQVFAALDGAGATAGRSLMRRRLGAAGLGALLLATLGWYLNAPSPEAPAAAAAPVAEEVVTGSATPATETPSPAMAPVEAPVVQQAEAPTTAPEGRVDAAEFEPLAPVQQPMDVEPLEQRSVQGVDMSTSEESDKALMEVGEKEGVWRMKARANVKE